MQIGSFYIFIWYKTQNTKLIWVCPSEYSGRAIRSCTAEIRQHAAAIPHASLLEAAAGCISCTVYTKLETQNSELETQNSKLKTSLVPHEAGPKLETTLVPHVYLMKNEEGGMPETAPLTFFSIKTSTYNL